MTAAETLSAVLAFLKVDPTGIGSDARTLPIAVPETTRDDFGSLFAALGFMTGAEIGVERGAFAEELCRRNPAGHLLCVDAWQAYGGYREHTTQGKLDGFYEEAVTRLASYHVTFLRAFSVTAAHQVPNQSLDYVYIDANHDLPNVIADIAAWTPKVKVGGIISGHDYQRRKPGAYKCHVVQGVHAWADAYGIAPWFVIGRHRRYVDNDTTRREGPRSWLWVKT